MFLTASQLTAAQALGGKGHGLRRLLAAGVPVPDFAVIPAETFDALLRGLPTDAKGLAQRRARLLEFTLTTADEQALRDCLTAWGFPRQPVVVRSSVVDEDGGQAAFAGLMDSFLNLTTLPQVLDAVARCAASAYSDRASAYRQHRGLAVARPAVVVQRQVRPVASGVLFSTLPEFPQELAIHAVWGFGEGLVGGTLQPDEFYFTKQTGQLSRHAIAHKPEQLVAVADVSTDVNDLAVDGNIDAVAPTSDEVIEIAEAVGAAGTKADSHATLHLAAVPAPDQNRACLTPAQLAELFALGTRLEQALGGPQDVEFVATADGVWVVQARPITQPIPEVVVYDNSNIQESYCGVTTPLTFSFAQRAYATVYRQTMRVLGLPAAQVAAHEAVVSQLLGLVRGRIYYNINNWYRGLQLLPAFRQNKADMERMMGLEEPVDFVTSQRKTLAASLRLLPRLALNLARLLWAFGYLKTRVAAFHAHFRAEYGRFYALPLATLPPAALLREKARLDAALLDRWTTPIINDFYVMMANGRVARALQKAGIADPDEFLSRYLAGDAQLAGTQPTHRLQALARLAWPRPALRELLLALPPDVHAQVARTAPDFYREVEGFIGQYGDRTAGELKLETRTMRVAPEVFYQYLRNFLLAEPPPPPTARPGDALHQRALQELAARLAGRPFWGRRQTWAALRQLQRAIGYREALRLERTRLFGMYRTLYLALGQHLTTQRQLAEPAEIFWLTEDEIATAAVVAATPGAADAPRPDPAPALPTLVAQRRREFAGYAREDVPSRVTVPSPPVSGAAPPENPRALRGTGCYPGTVEGEVLVITDPGGNLDVSGKIVCALRTDPGWAALFPMCRGVIIEKGSSLSHSVILLRELGIPTIINVPGVTKRLHSGQRIWLDGRTGEIGES
ncbi:PEP/pyruvate-binding domain-containing protein [Hymenobacter antarcticus]|uniref:Pyruvate, water dikinase n=1 Tax=Hymenobacter antarcticus TaxID=486270 RepID=A0ABP7NYF9_9BACT